MIAPLGAFSAWWRGAKRPSCVPGTRFEVGDRLTFPCTQLRIEQSSQADSRSVDRVGLRGHNVSRLCRFLRWRCEIRSPRGPVMRFTVADRLSLPRW